MRAIRRIINIHTIEGYKVFCLFNNGESRIIDFKKLFDEWGVKEGDLEYPLVKSEEAFNQVVLVDGTLTWDMISVNGNDEAGNDKSYPYDLDPIVLYENSLPDDSRQVDIGLMIKQMRSEMGLSQEELASRSGTTKHYISRIENNRTGMELSTLRKIIEGGLGKRMKISIH